jgi:hypothetical protein
MRDPWRASPDSLRKVLAQNGWVEEWPSSRMASTPEHTAKLTGTWFHRRQRAVLLVELECDGHHLAFLYREVIGRTPIAQVIAESKKKRK